MARERINTQINRIFLYALFCIFKFLVNMKQNVKKVEHIFNKKAH